MAFKKTKIHVATHPHPQTVRIYKGVVPKLPVGTMALGYLDATDAAEDILTLNIETAKGKFAINTHKEIEHEQFRGGGGGTESDADSITYYIDSKTITAEHIYLGSSSGSCLLYTSPSPRD